MTSLKSIVKFDKQFPGMRDRVTPKKGKDYFTEEDLAKITPQKGVDYRDGYSGRDGVDGPPGRDGVGKDGHDGKNGKDGKSPSIEEIVAEVLKRLPVAKKEEKKQSKIKFGITDIDGLKEELESVRSRRVSKGGHGGTLRALTTTTSDNQTYTFAAKDRPQYSETWVLRGGQVLHDLDGDFTYIMVGDRVKSITLNSALAVGETIRFRGK